MVVAGGADDRDRMHDLGARGDEIGHRAEFPVGHQASHDAWSPKDVGRLLLRCADRPGLVAAISKFLAETGANIVSLDQHATEKTGGIFMQRTIFHLPDSRLRAMNWNEPSPSR